MMVLDGRSGSGEVCAGIAEKEPMQRERCPEPCGAEPIAEETS